MTTLRPIYDEAGNIPVVILDGQVVPVSALRRDLADVALLEQYQQACEERDQALALLRRARPWVSFTLERELWEAIGKALEER